MAVVTLAEVKAHLRVIHDSDDSLIDLYIAAAEQQAADFLHRSVPWVDDEGVPVEVPAPIKAAVLLIVGGLYEGAEGAGALSSAVQSLLWPYRMQGFY